MPFATAGFAWDRTNTDVATKSWVVGGGLEYAISTSWSIKAEHGSTTGSDSQKAPVMSRGFLHSHRGLKFELQEHETARVFTPDFEVCLPVLVVGL
jgi:hypothetical protein